MQPVTCEGTKKEAVEVFREAQGCETCSAASATASVVVEVWCSAVILRGQPLSYPGFDIYRAVSKINDDS